MRRDERKGGRRKDSSYGRSEGRQGERWQQPRPPSNLYRNLKSRTPTDHIPTDDTTRKTTELPQLTGLVQPVGSDLCTELPSVQEPVSIKGTARASRSLRLKGGREATSLHQ